MTKKEKAMVEALLTQAALRVTADVEPDVTPSDWRDLVTGWLFSGESSNWPRVDVACSTTGYHAMGRTDKTTTQRGRSLYSTKLLCLRALRRAIERDCMQRLRKIDAQIEAESLAGGNHGAEGHAVTPSASAAPERDSQ